MIGVCNRHNIRKAKLEKTNGIIIQNETTRHIKTRDKHTETNKRNIKNETGRHKK